MKYLKICMAILLVACLLPLPYGYYNLMRIIAIICFGIMAYKYFIERKIELGIIFTGLIILFQPLIKIQLGRTLWNMVDVIVACLLLYLVFIYERKDK